jgi:curved DNA-binding protein CbpA
MRTFYDTLEVAEGASQETIAAAYRSLCKRYHPDTNKSPNATERLKEINQAYEILGDKVKRRHYDDSLHSQRRNNQTETSFPPFANRRSRNIIIKLILCGITGALFSIPPDERFAHLWIGLAFSSVILFIIPPTARYFWHFGLARIADISGSIRRKD